MDPDVFFRGEKVGIVKKYKYLGIIIDSTLSFKDHVKKVSNNLRFTLSNFRHLRNHMSTQAARVYLFSLILSHINYCLPTWSIANSTTLSPVMSLYKQAVKVLDKKPIRFHHCSVLEKHRLLSWDNLVFFKNCCLMYKIRNNLAPPPLTNIVKFRSPTTGKTRGAARGDCHIPKKNSQDVFSFIATHSWNETPQSIRDLTSYNTYKSNLKRWLLANQRCSH